MVHSPTTKRDHWRIAYGSTIFLSAFLLFTIQPLIAKRILPWFGGATAVWATCMVFFQILLLLGYLYAHVLTRFVKAGRAQVIIHLVLLASAFLFLPIAAQPPHTADISRQPAIHVLFLLARTLGLPFLVLASTSPLIQVWYRRQYPSINPYRLYALSNLGSMAALLFYPIVIEPLLHLGVQELSWSSGFLLFALLNGGLAWASRGPSSAPDSLAASAGATKISPSSIVLWILLSACASILLLATTTHLTTNVAPIPMLWVVPLALYLLSFILCFDESRWYRPRLFKPLAFASMLLMAVLASETFKQVSTLGRIPIFLLALFSACMVLHGELYRLKPDPAHLTLFYLLVSVGGALGGMTVGLAAPAFLNAHYELQIGIALFGLLLSVISQQSPLPSSARQRYAAAVSWLLISLVGIGTLFQTVYLLTTSVTMTRSFYGALRVSDEGEGRDRKRILLDGTITHGMEFLAPDRQLWPTTYFGPSTGIGLALRISQKRGPLKVGIIGLGAGTLAAYGRSGDVYRFYEINPQVVDVAMKHFGFLRQSQGRVEVVLGDARLSLDREAPQGYDVLILDAFSSDAIPMHLLTQEAASIYLRHLKQDGLLCFHISNRYLDLAPVVRSIQEHHGMTGIQLAGYAKNEPGTNFARWILLSKDPAHIKPFEPIGTPLTATSPAIQWTDDYSNLLACLRWKR